VCWRVLQHAQDAEDVFQATFLVLAAGRSPALARFGRTGLTRSPSPGNEVKTRNAGGSSTNSQAAAMASFQLSPTASRELHARARRRAPPATQTFIASRSLFCAICKGRTGAQAARQLGWSCTHVCSAASSKARVLLRTRLGCPRRGPSPLSTGVVCALFYRYPQTYTGPGKPFPLENVPVESTIKAAMRCQAGERALLSEGERALLMLK